MDSSRRGVPVIGWAMFGLSMVIVAVTLFAAYRILTRNDFSASQKDLPAAADAYRKGGWPWTAKEVDPRPRPTPSEDATPDLEAAMHSCNEGSFSKAEAKLTPHIKAGDFSLNLTLMGPFQHSMDLAMIAAKKPRLFFARDYDDGWDEEYLELRKEKVLLKMLVYEAEGRAATKDAAGAAKYLTAAQSIAKLSGEEPVLLSLLTEQGLEEMAIRGFENCAVVLSKDASGLRVLRGSLQPLPKPNLAFHLRTEAYTGLALMRNANLYGGVVPMLSALSDGSSGSSSVTKVDKSKLKRDGLPTDPAAKPFLDRDLRYWSMVNSNDPAFEKDTSKFDDRIQQIETTRSTTDLLVLILAPGMKGAVDRTDAVKAREGVTEAFLDAMITHALTGTFPKSMSEVHGKWIDPFDGKPLRVKVTKDTFRVYSIGPDRIDNGGVDRSETKGKSYDIVAMYPHQVKRNLAIGDRK